MIDVQMYANASVFIDQTWDWGKEKKEENDVGVWGPQ